MLDILKIRTAAPSSAFTSRRIPTASSYSWRIFGSLIPSVTMFLIATVYIFRNFYLLVKIVTYLTNLKRKTEKPIPNTEERIGDRRRKILHILTENFVFIWWMYDSALPMFVFFPLPLMVLSLLASPLSPVKTKKESNDRSGLCRRTFNGAFLLRLYNNGHGPFFLRTFRCRIDRHYRYDLW